MFLPHNTVPDASDTVCRYTGSGQIWDCAADGYDVTEGTILREGITQLSDWATGEGSPMAVDLHSFTATPQQGGIRLEWATVTEAGHAGFHIYRTSSPGGPSHRLTEALIPCQAPGSAQGASYVYDDMTTEPGVSYTYWLQDVDIQGATTHHGPVSAAATGPTVYLYVPLALK
jgi:hypothetical protein